MGVGRSERQQGFQFPWHSLVNPLLWRHSASAEEGWEEDGVQKPEPLVASAGGKEHEPYLVFEGLILRPKFVPNHPNQVWC